MSSSTSASSSSAASQLSAALVASHMAVHDCSPSPTMRAFVALPERCSAAQPHVSSSPVNAKLNSIIRSRGSERLTWTFSLVVGGLSSDESFPFVILQEYELPLAGHGLLVASGCTKQGDVPEFVFRCAEDWRIEEAAAPMDMHVTSTTNILGSKVHSGVFVFTGVVELVKVTQAIVKSEAKP